MSEEKSFEEPVKGVLDSSDTDENKSPQQGKSPAKPKGRPRKEPTLDPIDEDLKRWLKLYGELKGAARAYLPSFHSPLGQSRDFLRGLRDLNMEYPLWKNVRDFFINYAPSDAVLFEMLKHAKASAEKHTILASKDMGYSLGLMPDT